jgi:hypothetical protein
MWCVYAYVCALYEGSVCAVCECCMYNMTHHISVGGVTTVVRCGNALYDYVLYYMYGGFKCMSA